MFLTALVVVITITKPTAQDVRTTPQPMADSVVLLQIDGLSPRLLEQWLNADYGKAIRRLAGATSKTDAVENTFGSVLNNALVGSAITVIPSLADPASVTMMTGLPPRLHGVRTTGQVPNSELPSLHSVIRATGAATLSAGMALGDRASFNAAGVDDRTRLDSVIRWLRDHDLPKLVTMRFDTLADSLNTDSWAAADSALAQLDEYLETLLFQDGALLTPRTLVVLTAGYGASRLPSGAEHVPFALEGNGVVHAEGAAIVPTTVPPSDEDARRLDEELLFLVRQADQVKMIDPFLKGYRPLTEAETDGRPNLEQRALDVLNTGETLTLERRSPGNQVLFSDSPRPSVKYLARGSASEAESVVAMMFAGAPVQASAFMALPVGDLQAISTTILDALGLSRESLVRSPHAGLLTRSSLLPAEPTFLPRPPNLERLLANCRAASDSEGNVAEACKPLLLRSNERTIAAEILAALLADGVRRAQVQPESDTARAMLALAAWLAPDIRWPRNDRGLKAHWPGQRERCDARNAILVTAASRPVADAIQKTLDGLPDAAAFAIREEDRRVMSCLLSAPGPGVAINGDDWTQLVLRFSGAAVLVSGETAATADVTAATPWLSKWLGPPTLNIGDKQSIAERVRMALHLRSGLAAFHEGLFPRAQGQLVQAAGLTGLSGEWRESFAAYLEKFGNGDDTFETIPSEPTKSVAPSEVSGTEERWARAMRDVLRELGAPRNLEELIAPKLPRQILIGHLQKPEDWTGDRRTFLEAANIRDDVAEWSFHTEKGQSLRLKSAQEDRTDKGEALALVERLGNSGLAAIIRLRQLKRQTTRTRFSSEASAILELLGHDGAGWARLAASRVVTSAIDYYQPSLSESLGSRADDLLLSTLEREVMADQDVGDAMRSAARLTLLVPYLDRPQLLPVVRRISDRIHAAKGKSPLTALMQAVLTDEDGFMPIGMVLLSFNSTAIPAVKQLFLDWRSDALPSDAEDKVARKALSVLAGTWAAMFLSAEDAHDFFVEARSAENNLAVIDRRNALIKAGTSPRQLEITAPWIHVLARAGEAAVLATQKEPNPAAAKLAVSDGIDMLRRLLLSLDQQGGPAFDTQSNNLMALVEILAHQWIDGEKPTPETWRRALAVDIPLAPNSAHATLRRWLALADVVGKDYLWMIDSPEGRRLPNHARALDLATAKLTKLLPDWTSGSKKPATRHLLRVLLAIQLLLRELPPLDDKFGTWIAGLMDNPNSSLSTELKELQKSLEQEFPETERTRQLVYDDNPDALVPDLAIELIARFSAASGRSRTPRSQQFNTQFMLNALTGRLEHWASEVKARPVSRVGAIVSYVRHELARNGRLWSDAAAVLTRSSGQIEKALDRPEAVRSPGGPNGSCLLTLLAASAHMRASEWDRAMAAMDKTVKQCPSLEADVELGRVRIAATKGDFPGAYAALDRYEKKLTAAYMEFVLTYDYAAPPIQLTYVGAEMVPAILLPPETVEGSSNMTFGLRQDKNPDYPRAPALSIELAPKGSVTSAYETQLMMRAWLGFLQGDDAMAGRAISELFPPRVRIAGKEINDLAAEGGDEFIWTSDATRPIEDFVLGLWIATIAELRGHQSLAAKLTDLVKASAEQKPVKSEKRWYETACDGSDAIPEDSPRLLKGAECKPTALRWSAKLDPLHALVRLKARKMLEQKVDDSQWDAAVRAAAAALPRRDAKSGSTTDPAFACDAAVHMRIPEKPASAEELRLARACQANAVLAEALLAVDPSNSDDGGLDELEELLDRIRSLRRVRLGVAETFDDEQVRVLPLIDRGLANVKVLGGAGVPARLMKVAEAADGVGWRGVGLVLRSYAAFGEFVRDQSLAAARREFVNTVRRKYDATPFALALRRLLFATDHNPARLAGLETFLSTRRALWQQ